MTGAAAPAIAALVKAVVPHEVLRFEVVSRLGSVGAGRTGAIGASAVVAAIGTVGALARVVVTGRASAIGANTDCARIRTVSALAGSALVVVHPVGRAMFPVHMPIVQIVHVVAM